MVASIYLEDYGIFMNYNVYNIHLDCIDFIPLYVGNQSIGNDLGFDCYQSVYADIYNLEMDYYSFRAK